MCSGDSESGAANGWSFPGGPLHGAHLKSPFGNVIGSLEINIREILGVDIPWMTYIGDFDESHRLCRVYAHPLSGLPELKVVNGARVSWFTAEGIHDLAARGELAGGYEEQAIDLWLSDAFVRGMGIAKRPGSGPKS